jgi:hypothetical protein
MRGILIFYYIGGAGGKFIANLLTYSRQVAFTNYTIALRNDPEESNAALLATIPEKSDGRKWLELEHGCTQLFGDAVHTIKQQGRIDVAAKLNDLSVLHDQWLPIVAHYPGQVANIQQYFKDVEQRLIIVDADPDFIDLAIRLKWTCEHHCLDLEQYDQYQTELKELEPDYTFSAWDPRNPMAINQILEFAHWLGIKLDLTPATDYINRYRAFHL